MSARAPRIALISATPAAIPPAELALEAEFPEAQLWNLLDDRLLSDADAAGGLTPPLATRMTRLIDYAIDMGAEGVLLTCSMYGPVAQSYGAAQPVLAPDGPAFDEIAALPGTTVIVVASLEPALEDTRARLRKHLAEAGNESRLVGVLAKDARGVTEPEALADRIGAAVAPKLDGADLVFLAQFSLAPAAEALARRIGRPVLSGPRSAAVRLREALGS